MIRLEDRLGAEQAQLFHHFIEVGEYGWRWREIAGALAQDKIAITDQQREDMLALAARMKMDDLVPPRDRVLPAGPLTRHSPVLASAHRRYRYADTAPST